MSGFLTYEERLMIAQGLKEHKSFGVIAKELSKDRTAIAKEIKRHSAEKKPALTNRLISAVSVPDERILPAVQRRGLYY